MTSYLTLVCESSPCAQLSKTKKLETIEDAATHPQNQQTKKNMLRNKISEVVALMISAHADDNISKVKSALD